MEQGELDAAIEDLTMAIELAPRYAAIRYAFRGYAHWQKGEFHDALADCDAAVHLLPELTLGYCWRALAHAKLGHTGLAQSDLRQTLQTRPADEIDVYIYHLHLHYVAWFLATGPDPELRRPQQAAALAEEALKLRPKFGYMWATVGAAAYRRSDFPAALEALERCADLPSSRQAASWFFLAMTHWQLDNKQEARRWYEKASQWTRENLPHNWELSQLRAEAATLLGVTYD